MSPTPSLQVAYEVLRGLREQVQQSTYSVDREIVNEIERVLKDISSLKPGLLEQFDRSRFQSSGIYRRDGLLVRLNTDLAYLAPEIQGGATAVVLTAEEFTFIQDEGLRRISLRDYEQLQKGLVTDAWKAVIVLCGGLIEGLLLDLLQQDAAAARGSSKAPKESDIRRWDLNDLINVAADLKKLPRGIDRLSHSVREYRNLVHPGRELSSELRVEPEEARIAVEVLKIVVRELKPRGV